MPSANALIKSPASSVFLILVACRLIGTPNSENRHINFRRPCAMEVLTSPIPVLRPRSSISSIRSIKKTRKSTFLICASRFRISPSEWSSIRRLVPPDTIRSSKSSWPEACLPTRIYANKSAIILPARMSMSSSRLYGRRRIMRR